MVGDYSATSELTPLPREQAVPRRAARRLTVGYYPLDRSLCPAHTTPLGPFRTRPMTQFWRPASES
jgi:hypothetical protein